MKSFFNEYVFGPSLILIGFLSLFIYQNCSRDVDFNTRPSVERPPQEPGLNPQGPDGLVVGGNSEVIIKFNETPTDTTVDDTDTVIDYEVVTPRSEVTEVKCTLNGVEVPCKPTDRIPITNPVVGTNTFTIVATNANNQVGEQTVTWEVFRSIITVTRDIQVTAPDNRVDIIINVDNSGSMQFEQQSMANRISTFMDRFENLDYHIAVITTSPIGDATYWKASLGYVDGKFIELTNNVYCIRKSAQTKAQAEQLLQQNVVRSLVLLDDNGNTVLDPVRGQPLAEGNGWERGIFTTFRSIERYTQANSPESSCLRPNVAKHVVLISDEDETLTDNSGSPLPQIEKSDGNQLKAFMSATFGANVLFKFHSIVVNPYTSEGQTCLASHGATPGILYASLSRSTGGVIGSICAPDYGAQLGEIGQTISNSALSYPLACVAIPKEGQMGQVTSLSNNQPVTMNYSFNGDKVEFAQPLNPGSYRVTHFCYQ